MNHPASPEPAAILRALLTLGLATLLLSPPPTFAALGKTVDECRDLYGRPPYGNSTYELDHPARIKYFYTWHEISVTAQFVGRDVKDSRCAHVTYMKQPKPDEPRQELSKAEIAKVLAVNAHGHTWEPVPGGWKRSDNKALAFDASSGTPDHTIILFTADFYPNDSESFAQIRKSLPRPGTPSK